MRDPVGKSSKTSAKPVAKVAAPAPKKSSKDSPPTKSVTKSTQKQKSSVTQVPKMADKSGKPAKQAESKVEKSQKVQTSQSSQKVLKGKTASVVSTDTVSSKSAGKGRVSSKPDAATTGRSVPGKEKTEKKEKSTARPSQVSTGRGKIADPTRTGKVSGASETEKTEVPSSSVSKSVKVKSKLPSGQSSPQPSSRPENISVKSDGKSLAVKSAIQKGSEAAPATKSKSKTTSPVVTEPAKPARAGKPARSGVGKSGEADSSVPSKLHSAPVPLHPPVVIVETHHRQPSAVALKVFEQAVKVFNRRQFAEARKLFENLITRYPQEVEILARVSTYVHVCDQRLALNPNIPQNADELYDRGVFALNTGNFAKAREFFENALQIRPNEAHLLYSLAVTVLRIGSVDEALEYLKRSFEIQPRFRAQALNDSDFADLRENRKFLNLLGMTSPFDRFESKR